MRDAFRVAVIREWRDKVITLTAPVSLSVNGATGKRRIFGTQVADDEVDCCTTTDEKQQQIFRVSDFQRRHANERSAALELLRRAALDGTNTFEALMVAVRSCTLGEITDTLYEVGGQYRRNV